jgi:hypothetical protein
MPAHIEGYYFFNFSNLRVGLAFFIEDMRNRMNMGIIGD